MDKCNVIDCIVHNYNHHTIESFLVKYHSSIYLSIPRTYQECYLKVGRVFGLISSHEREEGEKTGGSVNNWGGGGCGTITHYVVNYHCDT